VATVPNSRGYYLSRKTEDQDIRIYGDTALVSGVIVTIIDTNRFKDLPRVQRAHQLRVYVRGAKGWQLAYQHLTWAVRNREQQMDVMRYISAKGYYDAEPGADQPAQARQ
jgi:hypothetical protein